MSKAFAILNMKKIITGILAVTLIAGCTAPIDIKTNDSDPVIVIVGQVTSENIAHTVRITSSAPYFDAQPNKGISGADVTIRSSTGETFTLSESTTEKGLYVSDSAFAGTAGVTYTLIVRVDFNGDGIIETYEAQTVMPEVITIDSLKLSSQTQMGFHLFSVNLYAPAPPPLSNFRANYSINGTPVATKVSMWTILDTELLIGDYLDGISIGTFFHQSEYDKFTESERENEIFVTGGDVVSMQFSQIDKHYFDFIDQAQSSLHGENPFFGGPPSNITTNISGGAIGFFSSMNFSVLSAVVPQ